MFSKNGKFSKNWTFSKKDVSYSFQGCFRKRLKSRACSRRKRTFPWAHARTPLDSKNIMQDRKNEPNYGDILYE